MPNVSISGSLGPLAASDLTNGTTGSGEIVLQNSAALISPALTTPDIGVAAAQGLSIMPAVGTIDQAIYVGQTGPSSATPVTGPIIYNEFEISHRGAVTNTEGADPRAMGLYLNLFTGGANQSGIAITEFVQLNHDQNSTSPHDHIAFVAQAYTSAQDTGGGEIYGANNVAIATTGSQGLGLNGLEIDMELDAASGATPAASFLRRTGLRIANQGAMTASTLDTAMSIASTTYSGSFGKMLSLTDQFGAFPLAQTADMFFSDSSGTNTINNVFNLGNVNVTGDILNFPNVVLTGAGNLHLTGEASSDQIQISSAAGNSRNIDFQTTVGDQLVQRFALVGADDEAESGANAGSNFKIQRYNDNGNFIDTPLLIERSTGQLTLGSPSSWTPNGTNAVSLGSTCPSANATPAEWLTIVDNNGVIRYIPCF